MRKVRSTLPPRVTQVLVNFGTGLKYLRVRRRMPMAYAADRVLISRSTLYKAERGMLERVEGVADPRLDRAGLAMDAARLPRRIR